MQEENASYDAAKHRWFRRTWVVTTAALLTGAIIGSGVTAVATATDVTASPEYRTVAGERDEVQETLAQREDEVADLNGQVGELNGQIQGLNDELVELEGDIPKREAAVEEAEAAVQKREKAVAALEKSVKKREKAVGIIEKEIAANTVSDGIYEVGVDIKAGTYKSDGGSGCYWKRSDNLDGDIKVNSLVDGPSVVTVQNGEFVEFDCGGAEWVLQR